MQYCHIGTLDLDEHIIIHASTHDDVHHTRLYLHLIAIGYWKKSRYIYCTSCRRYLFDLQSVMYLQQPWRNVQFSVWIRGVPTSEGASSLLKIFQRQPPPPKFWTATLGSELVFHFSILQQCILTATCLYLQLYCIRISVQWWFLINAVGGGWQKVVFHLYFVHTLYF